METYRVPDERRGWGRRALLAGVVALLLLNAAALGRFLLDVARWRDDPVAARKVLNDPHADANRVTNAATVLSRVALDAVEDLREVAAGNTPAGEHARIYLRKIQEAAGR